MNTHTIIGWDIGGAHVKAAVANQQGVIIRVIQQACPLWQGLDVLQQVVATIIDDSGLTASRHALTMTGELVDLFSSRQQGVKEIIRLMQQLLGEDQLLIYAGSFGFLAPSKITHQHSHQIASANWLASVSYVAKHLHTGLFVDIGSTTSDIVVFNQNRAQPRGFTDYQRLCTQELVYTGIIRTPVMAVARVVEFQGQPAPLLAEYFATMADVYRITGELNEHNDQMPAADNGNKSKVASLRRLARMIGCDVHDFKVTAWQQLATQLKTEQCQQIQQACKQQLDYSRLANTTVLVGAGIGQFLVRQIASSLGLRYLDMAEIIANTCTHSDIGVASCAPAIAVACLSKQYFNNN